MKALTEFDEGMRFLEDHAWEVAKASLEGNNELSEELLESIDDEIDYFYCMGVARGLWTALEALRTGEADLVEPEAPSYLN